MTHKLKLTKTDCLPQNTKYFDIIGHEGNKDVFLSY